MTPSVHGSFMKARLYKRIQITHSPLPLCASCAKQTNKQTNNKSIDVYKTKQLVGCQLPAQTLFFFNVVQIPYCLHCYNWTSLLHYLDIYLKLLNGSTDPDQSALIGICTVYTDLSAGLFRGNTTIHIL